MSNGVERIPKSLLDQQSMETLEQMLVQEFDRPEPDAEYMREIMESLEKKDASQFAAPADVEAALEDFHANYLTRAEDAAESGEKTPQPRRRKNYRRSLRRVASVAAVVAATLVCLIIVQASGVNILGAMGHWTDEFFRFTPSASSKLETFPSFDDTVPPEIGKVLTAYDIPTALAPKSIPEGMSLEEIKVNSSDLTTEVRILFSSREDEMLSYSILLNSSAESYTRMQFEKTDALVEEYVHNNLRFYLFENTGAIIALWSDGTNTIFISTERSRDAIYEIINCI